MADIRTEYTERVGSIYSLVVGTIHERRNRHMARYFAQVVDERDPQYPLVCCPHEHREPEAAIGCRNRLMKLAVEVAKPVRVGTGTQTVLLDPDQVRGAIKIILANRGEREATHE